MDTITLIEALADNVCALSCLVMAIGVAVSCVIFSTRPIHVYTSGDDKEE